MQLYINSFTRIEKVIILILPVSPLLFATIRGNLQMFPVPTTHPRQDRIRPHLVENSDVG